MTFGTEASPESRPQQGEPLILRLYVAGRAPNSVRAIANLRLLCEEYFPDQNQVEIIDVLEEPLRAIADDILATPTLVKVSPGRERKIIGNLSEKLKVLHTLEIGDGLN
jgi:circadian clock protein KaiB